MWNKMEWIARDPPHPCPGPLSQGTGDWAARRGGEGTAASSGAITEVWDRLPTPPQPQNSSQDYFCPLDQQSRWGTWLL